jgi:hypothetical protein
MVDDDLNSPKSLSTLASLDTAEISYAPFLLVTSQHISSIVMGKKSLGKLGHKQSVSQA